jgi:hypothetical protein
MKFFRVAWVVLAIVVLGLDATGIPYAYGYYANVCTLDARTCFDDGLLTPERARELEELGLSRGFYAAHDVGLSTVVTLVCFAVAAVIFLRRSDDGMALFTSYVLLLFGGAGAAGTMQELVEAHPAFWFPVHLLDYVSQVCFGIFFYVFPDGRFVPRWTRVFAVLSLPFFVLDIFFPESSLATAAEPFFLVFVGTLVVAQVYRYRRVSTTEQRQQTKWVVFGIAVALVGFVVIVGLFSLIPALWQTTGPLSEIVIETIIYGLLLLIPLSIGVAVLRSRLYDIDVVINRALVYGPLTAALVALYVGSVVSLQYVFQALTGGGSQLAVVASTLLIAALFNALRLRIQGFIDRRFYRSKYDARRTLEAFSTRLRNETNLEQLNTELMSVVRETVQPEHVSFWLAPDRGKENGDG